MKIYPIPIANNTAPTIAAIIPKNCINWGVISSVIVVVLLFSVKPIGAADKNTPNATKDRPPNIAIIPMIIVRIAMIVTPVGLLTFSVKYLYGEGYRTLV